MNIDYIATDLAPKAIGAYSQAVSLNGVYYFSGQIGIDPKTKQIDSQFSGQLGQILKNIDGLLESQGLNRKNIVKTTIFLTDMNNFSFVNQAYEEYFSGTYPARSCVEVSRLPMDTLVEIEVMASR